MQETPSVLDPPLSAIKLCGNSALLMNELSKPTDGKPLDSPKNIIFK